MSLAGKASGQRKARIAMYCAVQSPMPGSARSVSSAASSGAPRCSCSSPRATARAERLQRAHALAHDAELAERLGGRAAASASALGNSRSSPANGVSIGVAEALDQAAGQRARRRSP